MTTVIIATSASHAERNLHNDVLTKGLECAHTPGVWNPDDYSTLHLMDGRWYLSRWGYSMLISCREVREPSGGNMIATPAGREPIRAAIGHYAAYALFGVSRTPEEQAHDQARSNAAYRERLSAGDMR